MRFLLNVVFFIMIFFSLSCKHNNNQEENIKTVNKLTKLKYAKGFSIEEYSDYKMLNINSLWLGSDNKQHIVLYENEKPQINQDVIYVKVPIKKVSCLSLTHISFLQELNVLHSITSVANAQLVNNKSIQTKIKNNNIKNLGDAVALNKELLIEDNPEVVFTYGVDNSSNEFVNDIKKIGLKPIIIAEHMENHPLGKAEWIKFFAVFYGLEKKANKVFSEIEQRYNSAKQITDTIVANRPTVLCALPWNDKWYLPGGKSFQAQFIKDAGANYLWEDNNRFSSFVLDKEVIIDRAINADYWIHVNQNNSLKDLINLDRKYAYIKAVKDTNVYNNNNIEQANKANMYWENGVVNPDIILKDLIKIFHPHLIKHKLHYYKQLK